MKDDHKKQYHSSTYYMFALLLLQVFILALWSSCNQPIGKKKYISGYVHTRGINMYYEIHGHGIPLLMIHGNNGSSKDLYNQTYYFSKLYKVILADSRAQGKSVDTQDSISYEMMADDLNALLDTLHLDSCYVIGWSDGGVNGLLLALRHPDKVKKLALSSANLWPDTSAIDPYMYQWIVSNCDKLKKLEQTPPVKNTYKLTHLLLTGPHISAMQLHTIQCPTLVIGGDHDIIRPKHTLLIASSIPKSYLWIIPNSGHGIPIVYKNQFNQVVSTFFRNPYRQISGPERQY